MIGVDKKRDRNCGAPEAECRMTMTSGRMADSVLRVSTSDSPFDRLEPSPEMEIVSAPSLLAAISKLARVLVEASKNRLTIVLPQALDPQQAAPGQVRGDGFGGMPGAASRRGLFFARG